MTHILDEFKLFLDTSPTSWHAARQIGNRLALHDFNPLSEEEKWHLEPGQKYFVSRGGAVCAFCLPSATLRQAIILGSHTDSPGLKLKPQPENHVQNMATLGVEVYGGALLSSWLNRDLGIAGRVTIENSEGGIEEHLVLIDEIALIIPQLAIHLDKEVNEKGLILNKQDHLCPLLGLDLGPANTDSIKDLIHRQIPFKSLLSHDLFLFPLEKSRFLGLKNELIASWRLDNLAGAHACLTSLACVKKPQPHTLQMAVFWDHEEIGSASSEGASSPFFSDILKRIAFCLKLTNEELCILKNRSLCVSVDMAHALNPNYVKMHDPRHQPLLGRGIVLKSNANLRYATNATSAARIVQACQKLKLHLQTYVNRSDIPCGSTIGPLMSSRTGVPTVDIGCPQLSMHSVREVMAFQDYFDLCRLLTHFLKEG